MPNLTTSKNCILFRWLIKDKGHLKRIPESSRFVQTKSALKIHDTHTTDAGEYVCEINNELGNDDLDIHLSIGDVEFILFIQTKYQIKINVN